MALVRDENGKLQYVRADGTVAASSSGSWHDKKVTTDQGAKDYNNFLYELDTFQRQMDTDFKSREGKYQSADTLGRTKTRTDERIAGLRKKVGQFESYFNTNSGLYDDESVSMVGAQLADAAKFLDSVRDAAKSEQDYWSQWETEDDYNTYSRRASMDIGNSQKTLEAKRAELKKAEDELAAAQRSSMAMPSLTGGTSDSNGPAAWDRAQEAQKKIEALRREIGLAEVDISEADRIQRSQMYAKRLELPDIDVWAKRGASIKNPTFEEVEGTWEVTGKDKREGKIGNIVAYSRDNWERLAAEDAETGTYAGSVLYHYMTKDEVKLYNATLAKEGKAAAKEFLDYLMPTLQARYGAEQGKNISGIQNPIAKTAALGFFSLGAGTDQWVSGTKQLFTGETLPTSPTQVASQTIQDSLGKTGKLLYGAGTTIGNMLPSIILGNAVGGIAGATAGKVASAVSMGGASAGNTYNQVMQAAAAEGYTRDQAMTYAGLVGASEAMLSYLIGGAGNVAGVGEEKLLAKVAGIDNVFARLALSGVIRIGSEEAEELAQLWIEPVLKTLILGTEFEAPTWEEHVETAIITALSTGILEGGSLIGTEIDYGQYGKYLLNNSNKYQQSGVYGVIGEALANLDPKSKAYRMAQAMQEQLSSGVNPTYSDIGRLHAMLLYERSNNGGKGWIAGINAKERISDAPAVTKGPVSPGSEVHNAAQEVVAAETERQEAMQQTTQEAWNQAAARAFGETGAKAFQTVNDGSIDSEALYAGFAVYHHAGMTGRDMNTITSQYAKNLPEDLRKIAYDAGVQDAAASVKARTEAAATATVYGKDAGVIANDYSKSMDQDVVRTLDRVAKSLGRKVVVEDLGDSNGLLDSNGVIHVDFRAENPHLVVAAHEVTHVMEDMAPAEHKRYRDYVLNKMADVNGGSILELVEAQKAAYAGKQILSDEQAMNELVADYTARMMKDRNLFDEFAKKDRTAAQKLLDAVKKFLQKVKAVFSGNRQAQNEAAQREFGMDISMVEEAAKLWQEALTASQAQAQTVGGNTIDTDGVVTKADGTPVAAVYDNGSTRLSLKTYKDGGRSFYEAYLEKQVRSKNLTADEATDMLRQLDAIYDICNNYRNKYAPFGAWSDASVQVDSKGNPVFSVIKKNGEYVMNLDFSLVCKKRRTLDGVFNLMVKNGMIDKIAMGEADIVKINDIIRSHGFETACALCFVDAKRFRQANVALQFADIYNDMVKSMIPEGSNLKVGYHNFGGNAYLPSVTGGIDTLADSELDMTHINEVLAGAPAKKANWTVEHKVADYLKRNPADRKLVDVGDFMSTAGFEQAQKTKPGIMGLYNAKKGSGGPKAAFGDVQYLNDILKRSTAFNAKKAYAIGGVRVQSFSDYVPRMVFDYVQMISELAAKKLPAHAYTKEPLFAMQYGMTGMKINLSLIPKVVEGGIAPGLDANGNYVWADESFPYDVAVQIQNAEGYSKNCGSICVGVSDEHIRALMADDNIRMVIPYHKSGLNHIVASMNKIDQFEDYTNVQNTRYADSGTKLSKEDAKKEIGYNQRLLDTGDPRKAAEEYVRWCEENNYLPKFDQFAYAQIDGEYVVDDQGKRVVDENYYKLLEDFTGYDNGTYAPQGAVTMNFPTEGDAFGSMAQLIEQGLEEDAILEANRTEKLPKILDDIASAFGIAGGDEVRRSVKGGSVIGDAVARAEKLDAEYMAAVNSGDMETAQRMVDEAAKAAGYDTVVYHGTPNTNTEVNPKWEDAVLEIHEILLPESQPLVPKSGSFYAFDNLLRYRFGAIKPELRAKVPKNLLTVARQGPVRNFTSFDLDRAGESTKTVDSKDGIFVTEDEEFAASFRKTFEHDPLMDETRATSVGDGALYKLYLRPDETTEYRKTYTRAGRGKSRPVFEIVVKNADQLKSSDPVTYDDNGNIIPLSQRFNSGTNDIRFSRKGGSVVDAAAARAEDVDALKRQVEYWKSQVKRTKGFKVNTNDVEKLAKQLMRTYKVDTDTNVLTKKLQDLYDGIATGYYGNKEIDYETAQARSEEIAKIIVEDAVETENEMYVEYAELRKYLRSTTLNISAEDSHDIPDFNDFRKRNMGRMRIGTKGTNIDTVYKEMATLWPEFFNEETETTPSDQLLRIAEVMEGVYRTQEVNPFGRYAEEAVSDIADEVLAYFFTLPQAQTFADKAAARLKQATADATLAGQMAQGRRDAALLRRSEELAARAKQRAADALAKEKQRGAEAMQKLKQDSEEKLLAALMAQGRRDAETARLTKERADEARKRAKERSKAAELRGKIIRHSRDMSQKLLRPTDKKHVPEELQSAVAAVLKSINLESASLKYVQELGPDGMYHRVSVKDTPYVPVTASMTNRTKAFRQLREAYKKLAGEIVVDPALFSTDGDKAATGPLLEAVLDMGDISIEDMTVEQLSAVWRVLKAMEQSVRKANKLFLSAKYETISEMASQLQSDSIFRKPKKAVKAPKFLGGSGNLTLDLEIPLTFFSQYGEVGAAMYKELRDAQDYQERLIDQLADQVGKIVTPKRVQEMQKEVHTFKTEDGDELKLTTAHMMELYELSKRKQAEDHLLKGGIVQPEIQSAKVDRGTDMIKLTATDIGEIISKLTKEQKEIADALQGLLTTTLADAGNRASMQAYGYKKFTGTDYWPIKSAQEALHHKVEKGANNTRSIKNIGLAQQVVPHANTALNLSGIFQTFAGHATDMIDYAAWLCPMEDANRLFNYKYKDTNGIPTGKTVKGVLDKVGGSGSQAYWSNLMEDIQNGIGGPGDSAFAGIAARITGNVKGASVGANIRVVVQQPTAIFRAAAILSPANLSKGLTKGVTKGNGWKKALEYSDIAKRKDRGGFEISNQMQMSEILYDDRTRLARFNDTMSWAAAKADAITWGKIWNACEWQVHGQNKALQPGSEEFYRQTAELFADVINESQVVDGVLQRSQIMRSSNQISKQMTSFMGEPTMSLNMLMRAYDALRYEQDPAKRSKARKQAARVAAALLVTDIMTAVAQSLIDGLRDDDREKKYWQRILSAFTGVTGDEDSAWDKAVGVVLSGNLVSTMNPVGRLPYAKDLLSLIQGYSVERMDISAFSDLISAGTTFVDSLNGTGTKTWAYATKQLATAGSKVLGISAANILRDVWSIARSIAIETGNLQLQYEMEKAIYKISNDKNDSRYIGILYDAMKNDREAYEMIYADMVKNGVAEDKIAQGIEKRMKADQGVTKVEDLSSRYLTPNQEKEYDKAYSRVTGTQVWKSATEEQREKLEGNLYDLTVGNGAGEDLREKIEPGRDVGVDEVEYLLYKLAQEVVSEDGNKNTSQAEAEAAAELLTGLSKDEQAWLWQSTNKSWKSKNNPFN